MSISRPYQSFSPGSQSYDATPGVSSSRPFELIATTGPCKGSSTSRPTRLSPTERTATRRSPLPDWPRGSYTGDGTNSLSAVETAGSDPTDPQLHTIRIAAKRCRYAAEAVAPVVGRPARRFADAIEDVQSVLGDYHDTVVAEAWLRDVATELVDCRIAIGGLIARERKEREHLRDAWPAVWKRASKKKLRAWFSSAHGIRGKD